jgi:hydroxyacylglutathione hydrolase
MKSESPDLKAPQFAKDSHMVIESLMVGAFQENTYVVVNKDSKEALIIDPGDEANRIADKLSCLGATPVAILLTHGHIDHVLACADLKEKV